MIVSFCSLSVHWSQRVFSFLSFWTSYAVSHTNIITHTLVTTKSRIWFCKNILISHPIIIPINPINNKLQILVRSRLVLYQYRHIIKKIAAVTPKTEIIELSWNMRKMLDNTNPLIVLYATNIIWAVISDIVWILALRYRTSHSSKANMLYRYRRLLKIISTICGICETCQATSPLIPRAIPIHWNILAK